MRLLLQQQQQHLTTSTAETFYRVGRRAVKVALDGSGGEGRLLLRDRRAIGCGGAAATVRVQKYAVRVPGHVFRFPVVRCCSRRGGGG